MLTLRAVLAVLLVAVAGCQADPWGSDDDTSGACTPPEVDCGGVCTDVASDPQNCGSCGHTCDPDQICHDNDCLTVSTDCEDECAPPGAEECYGNGIRTCGEYDLTDICSEWSDVEMCEDGYVCDPATVTCVESEVVLPDPFSIAVLPDTQYYTGRLPNDPDNTYYHQAQWIIDHQVPENIELAVHLGDVTDDNTTSEWEIASEAHAMLEAAGVPYSIVPGNHDYLDDGFGRANSLFGDYFGQSRFAGQPWYGGAYDSSNTSNYVTFEVDSLQFLVVSLEYAPRKGRLCWAEDVIAAHPDHRVIVVTHCYQTHGGGYTTSCPRPHHDTTGADGQMVWDELVSHHSNVIMTLAGHVTDSEYRASTGNNGNTVHEMLVDYQAEVACSESQPESCDAHCGGGDHTGNGWLRLLTFDPAAGLVYAETFSAEEGDSSVFPGGDPVLYCSDLCDLTDPDASGGDYYDQDPGGSDHLYDFPLDLATPLTYAYDDLGLHAFTDRIVNSVSSGDQDQPAIAVSADGSFVAVWDDDASTADGSGNLDVLVRGFSPGGCESFADICVHGDTSGDQQEPAVAVDASGNFVVTWADDRDGNGSYQVRARGFAPDGSERIAEFVVNSVATGQQRSPAIAMAPDGRFVIAWKDDPQNDDDYQVMMRGFAADGSQLFADMSVHDDDQGDRKRPALGMDGSGNFVVAWQDDGDGNGSYQIHARGFDASGVPRYSRVVVNTVATGQQKKPSIGVATAGSFVVAWQDDQENDGDFDIMARTFAADGTAQTEWTVASGGQRRDPAVSMAPSGAFAIAWEDDGDGNGAYQIKAATWTATGAEWMAESTINKDSSGDQVNPDIGLADDGTMVVLWGDDMDGNGLGQIVGVGFDAP